MDTGEVVPQPKPAEPVPAYTSSVLVRVLIGRRPRTTLIRLCLLIVVTLVLFGIVFIPIRVTGNSMAPTYQTGRVNLVNRLAYRWHDPKRGDVVSIRLAGLKVLLLKRIIGLPGETISVHAGSVYIDDQRLNEPYISAKVSWAEGRRQLKADEYFVVGDNRAVSEYYIIPKSQIAGKIVF